MPRLTDLLEYLAHPGLENLWLLLDIKVFFPVFFLATFTLFEINWPYIDWQWRRYCDETDCRRYRENPTSSTKVLESQNHPWLLGCKRSPLELFIKWSWLIIYWQTKKAKYIPLCTLYLPTFPITHIGFSISYARRFFSIPNVSFNMLQKILMGPAGNRFLLDAKRLGRPVLCWTVNEENLMRWCIQNGLDGVITDDPKNFLEVCDQWEQGKRKIHVQPKDFLLVLWLNLMVALFGRLFQWKYPFRQGLSSYNKKKARGFEKLWHLLKPQLRGWDFFLSSPLLKASEGNTRLDGGSE